MSQVSADLGWHVSSDHQQISMGRIGHWLSLTRDAWWDKSKKPLAERYRLWGGSEWRMAWHWKHGPPRHSRLFLTDVSKLLWEIWVLLPRNRVSWPTLISRDPSAFVRRYGARLCDEAVREDAVVCIAGEMRLQTTSAYTLSYRWLLRQTSCKGWYWNNFEWFGFWLTRREAEWVCWKAVEVWQCR